MVRRRHHAAAVVVGGPHAVEGAGLGRPTGLGEDGDGVGMGLDQSTERHVVAGVGHQPLEAAGGVAPARPREVQLAGLEQLAQRGAHASSSHGVAAATSSASQSAKPPRSRLTVRLLVVTCSERGDIVGQPRSRTPSHR